MNSFCQDTKEDHYNWQVLERERERERELIIIVLHKPDFLSFLYATTMVIVHRFRIQYGNPTVSNILLPNKIPLLRDSKPNRRKWIQKIYILYKPTPQIHISSNIKNGQQWMAGPTTWTESFYCTNPQNCTISFQTNRLLMVGIYCSTRSGLWDPVSIDGD